MFRQTLSLSFAILTLAALAARADHYPLSKSDDIHRELPFAGAARSVVIDNVFGSVSVRAGAGDHVTVDIHRTIHARREADLERGMKEVTFETRSSAGRIELGQDGPFRDGGWGSGRHTHSHWGNDWDPDYEIDWKWQVTLPAGVDLEVRNVNGGPVEVTGVSGAVDAKNVNGELHLSGLIGRVEAATVNGDLTADFARAPSEASSFRTVNGEVRVGLPQGSGAELGFQTLNGEIYTDFDVVALARPVEPTADRGGGRHRYRLEKNTVVRIGSGGPRIDCQTLNGDIVIQAR